MIISKYSGNVVGFRDYFPAAGERVGAVARISRSERLRRDQYLPDILSGDYARFCLTQASVAKTIKKAGPIGQRLCHLLGIYNCHGVYRPCYETGGFLDIRI